MNSKVRFSVIVPIYNAENTLQRCVDSIINQDCVDFELILVNDGSTDHSGAICDVFCSLDKRIRSVHKENGGVSSARNIGLKMSKGEWIVFVDADDALEQNWLSVFADNVYNLGSQILVTLRAKMLDGNICQEVLHSNHTGLIDKDAFYRGGQFGYLWNKCFSKDIIDSAKIRFDESMKCFEDEMFILEYSKYIHSFYIPDTPPMYNYFLPQFDVKYQADSVFSRQYYRYCKTKEISQAASTILVDWLIMTMFKECAGNPEKIREYALAVRDAVGEDIKYALGLKKILLRTASTINLRMWWIFVVWFYSKLYKFGLLK